MWVWRCGVKVKYGNQGYKYNLTSSPQLVLREV
jgi:hypothetical protein